MIAELKDRLHQGLLARGYSLVDNLEGSASFGSWYQDYVRADRRVRLIWDGRDEWFVLQGGRDWQDLSVMRPAELTATGVSEFLGHTD
jgi:hypothetical protein